MKKVSFGSDNHSGVHPEVLNWILRVNEDPAQPYGKDTYTQQANEQFEKHFGTGTEAYIVWNGTAANVLALRAAIKPFQAILCSDMAHIHLDECGAPEQHTGGKLLPLRSKHGKIDPSDAATCFKKAHGDVQSVQPKVISLSQTTEYGTLYSRDEIKAFAKLAHEHNAYLHIDGARFANAAAAQGGSLQSLSRDLGVDVLSFGGTKNGLLGAEAILFFNPTLAQDFQFIRKQGLHLASKSRFLAAQFLAYFENNLWRKNAEHANAMTQKLSQQLAGMGIEISQPTQANALFAILPQKTIDLLQGEFRFYVWNAATREVRIMCSFNTENEQIERFAAAVQKTLS